MKDRRSSLSVRDFEARAEAAWEHYQATGESVSTAEVLAKLQAKLDAKRQLLLLNPAQQPG